MAWHHRHIAPTDAGAPAGGLRTSVVFARQDLLWAPDAPLRNPYTGAAVRLPVAKAGTDTSRQPVYLGPNVLDLVVRDTREREPPAGEADGAAPDATADISWRLREADTLLVHPRQRQTQGSSEHPFQKRFCTGGRFVAYADGFVLVDKRSSVSISTQVYRLAAGMQGSPQAASNRIGTLAAAVWARDLLRARELYTLVRDRGVVPDVEVPERLKASATVSQEVEHAILRDACVWLGVDPDRPVERKRGRPKSRRGGQSQAGEVIELTLEADGTVTGRLIAAFAGWPQGTILAALTVPKLAALLVALRDAELVDDAELLEAYLDAAVPDWRERIAEEIGRPSAGGLPEDPWTLLGVARGAGAAEIKRAYRTLMRAVHPDTTGLPDWISKIVNDAHRHIMEEMRRG